MSVVYALSDKGVRECAAERSALPVELHDLLRMVDGRRTREDLLAATGKNALTAGGLRWLTASGYIHASVPAVLEEPFSPLPRGPQEVCRAMSNFMIRSIHRHLEGYPGESQIRSAATLDELLPHLNPLIDAIVARAGAQAGAEFADTAAFLLHPPR